MKYHCELVEATRSSVLDGRGLDPFPVNDIALQEAVDAFLPPLDSETVGALQYDAAVPIEMAANPPAVASALTAEVPAATAPTYLVTVVPSPPPSIANEPGLLPVTSNPT